MTDDEVEVRCRASDRRDGATALRWRDERRGEELELTTLNVRLLPDGHLAVKAYRRPTAGGRGTCTAFRVPDRPELAALVRAAAERAAPGWAANRGLG